MRRLLLFTAAVLMMTFVVSAVAQSKLNIIPYPNEVNLVDGYFKVKGASVTYDASFDDVTIAAIKSFAEKLSYVSGSKISIKNNSAKGFLFRHNAYIAPEAYYIDVDSKSVCVEASSFRGFNHAIQTLKQLLPIEVYGDKPAPKASWVIPAVSIKDAPRFGYRGMHLDVVRHFFDVDIVKKYLDIMEMHKLNKFHWHLTDDQGWRIEIKKYPRLTEVGSIRYGTCIKDDFSTNDGVTYGESMYYTQDQIREIVAYAASKGIDVIPEIDLPGHMMGALAAYPELGCTGGPYNVWTRWGVSPDVLCAGNEKVYEFIEDVLSEVCELFPGEYVHIGGDECPKTTWEKCPKCQAKIAELGLKDTDDEKAEHFLQSYVITHVEKILNDRGRKVIGWDEILEGGVAPNATVMSWRGTTGGLKAASMGHDAIMTPRRFMYFDRYQSRDIQNEPFGIGGYLPVQRVYNYEPYPEGMTDVEKAHILGVQANIWTEYIATEDHLFYMLLPRLAALSEVQWCKEGSKDWDRFYATVARYCEIYKLMGYNVAPHVLQGKGIEVPAPEKK